MYSPITRGIGGVDTRRMNAPSSLRSQSTIELGASVRMGEMPRSNLASSVISRSARSVVSSISKKPRKSAVGPAIKKGNIKDKKSEPTCCSISLIVVFGIACAVIAVVFGAISAYSSIAFANQVEVSVKQNLATAMQGAMKYVTDPLIQSQQYAEQLKTMIESSPSRYSCDDSSPSFPGNSSSVNFFYEAGMYALHRPGIQFIYQSRLSSRYLRTDGMGPAGVCCMIAPDERSVRYFVNNTKYVASFTNGTYLENLPSKVPTTTSRLDITPLSLIRGPAGTNTSRWVSDSIAASAGLGVPTNKYSYIVRLNDLVNPNSNWAVSIDHNMFALEGILKQATPPITVGDLQTEPTQTDGAHTTMYDLNEGLLMASTHDDVPVYKSYGVLYPMGDSPSTVVNEAFFEAMARCGATGCTNAVVTIGSSTVHTAYRINIPASKLHLMMVSSVPKEFFFADATRTFAVTLSLSIVCCALIVAGCVVLLVVIHRPLSSLKENMLLAAELHNDRVDHTRTYLSEIAAVSAVFDGMNQQLLIARSFVPEAVLLGRTEDTQDMDDEGSVVTDVDGKSSLHIAKDTATLLGTHNTSNNSTAGLTKLFNINEKRVAVLSLNLVGFHALCAPERQYTRGQKIHDISTTLLGMAVSCAHGERGVMDSFHGDHFTLTFNASRSVSGPLAAAVRTASAFIADAHECDQLRGAVCGVAAGAAVGKAHVGTYGMDGYRRLSVIGEVYRSAYALQQAAVQFLRMNGGGGFKEGCMVEESSQRDLGHCAIHLQAAGCLQSSQHRAATTDLAKSGTSDAPTPPLVYFAMDASADRDAYNTAEADGEWLYELDAIESADPYSEPNRAMRALVEGDIALCGQILDSHDATLTKRRTLHGSAIDESTASIAKTTSTIVRDLDEESQSSANPVEPREETRSDLAWQLVRRCYVHTSRVASELSASPNAASAVVRQCTLPYLLFQQ